MGRRDAVNRLLLVLLVMPIALGACRVMRYPAEKSLPRPIPDASPELVEEMEEEARQAEEAHQERSKVAQAVAVGQSLVGKARVVLDEKTWPSDCSGFVRACLAQVGLNLVTSEDRGASGTEIFYCAIERRGGIHTDDTPAVGDLVFFSNTYDRNGNKRLDDEFTHMGLVESVGEDGTVHFLHYIGKAVRIGRINLLRPHVHADDETGTILNDFLRRRRQGDGDKVRYLASELWVAFGRITQQG